MRAHGCQKAFDSIWRNEVWGQPGPAPADLLYLTSDLHSSLGTGELGNIADLLAHPIAQRKQNFSVLGIDVHDNYMLGG